MKNFATLMYVVLAVLHCRFCTSFHHHQDNMDSSHEHVHYDQTDPDDVSLEESTKTPQALYERPHAEQGEADSDSGSSEADDYDGQNKVNRNKEDSPWETSLFKWMTDPSLTHLPLSRPSVHSKIEDDTVHNELGSPQTHHLGYPSKELQEAETTVERAPRPLTSSPKPEDSADFGDDDRSSYSQQRGQAHQLSHQGRHHRKSLRSRSGVHEATERNSGSRKDHHHTNSSNNSSDHNSSSRHQRKRRKQHKNRGKRPKTKKVLRSRSALRGGRRSMSSLPHSGHQIVYKLTSELPNTQQPSPVLYGASAAHRSLPVSREFVSLSRLAGGNKKRTFNMHRGNLNFGSKSNRKSERRRERRPDRFKSHHSELSSSPARTSLPSRNFKHQENLGGRLDNSTSTDKQESVSGPKEEDPILEGPNAFSHGPSQILQQSLHQERGQAGTVTLPHGQTQGHQGPRGPKESEAGCSCKAESDACHQKDLAMNAMAQTFQENLAALKRVLVEALDRVITDPTQQMLSKDLCDVIDGASPVTSQHPKLHQVVGQQGSRRRIDGQLLEPENNRKPSGRDGHLNRLAHRNSDLNRHSDRDRVLNRSTDPRNRHTDGPLDLNRHANKHADWDENGPESSHPGHPSKEHGGDFNKVHDLKDLPEERVFGSNLTAANSTPPSSLGHGVSQLGPEWSREGAGERKLSPSNIHAGLERQQAGSEGKDLEAHAVGRAASVGIGDRRSRRRDNDDSGGGDHDEGDENYDDEDDLGSEDYEEEEDAEKVWELWRQQQQQRRRLTESQKADDSEADDNLPDCKLGQWTDWSEPLGFGVIERRRFVVAGDENCKMPESQGELIMRVDISVYNDKHTYYKAPEEVGQDFEADFTRSYIPRDLLLVLDSSGSIEEEDFELMRAGVDVMVRLFCGGFGSLNTNNRLAILLFASDMHLIHRFSDDQSPEALRDVIANLTQPNGNTCTGDALQFAHDVIFSAEFGSRPDVVHDTLLVTDGHSNCGKITVQEGAQLLQEVSNVFALGVGVANDTAARWELNSVVSENDPRHIFSLARFQDFKDMLDSIAQRQRTEPCLPIVDITSAPDSTHAAAADENEVKEQLSGL